MILKLVNLRSLGFIYDDISHHVIDLASHIFKERVFLNLVLSINNVIAFLDLVDELHYIFNGMLEVVIHRNDVIAFRIIEARHDRIMLPEISGKVEYANVFILIRETP